MQSGNRQVIESKLQEHFLKIRRAVDGFEQQSKQKLEYLIDSQS
jgi:hypothetical protein